MVIESYPFDIIQKRPLELSSDDIECAYCGADLKIDLWDRNDVKPPGPKYGYRFRLHTSYRNNMTWLPGHYTADVMVLSCKECFKSQLNHLLNISITLLECIENELEKGTIDGMPNCFTDAHTMLTRMILDKNKKEMDWIQLELPSYHGSKVDCGRGSTYSYHAGYHWLYSFCLLAQEVIDILIDDESRLKDDLRILGLEEPTSDYNP